MNDPLICSGFGFYCLGKKSETDFQLRADFFCSGLDKHKLRFDLTLSHPWP
jgi:hypothetical protein